MRSVRQMHSRKWHQLDKFGLITRHGAVRALVSAPANRIAAETSDVRDGSSDAPYWQQGDTSLYTEDNLRRRMALRHDPDVIEALQLWWSCACAAAARRSKPADSMSRVCDSRVRAPAPGQAALDATGGRQQCVAAVQRPVRQG